MTVRSAAVSVASSQTRLTTAQNRGSATAPSQVLVQNLDAVLPVFVGGSDVTSVNGFRLAPGTHASFVLVQEGLWGVVTSGTADVRVLETQR